MNSYKSDSSDLYCCCKKFVDFQINLFGKTESFPLRTIGCRYCWARTDMDFDYMKLIMIIFWKSIMIPKITTFGKTESFPLRTIGCRYCWARTDMDFDYMKLIMIIFWKSIMIPKITTVTTMTKATNKLILLPPLFVILR